MGQITKNIKNILNILNSKMDSDRLSELNITETEYRLNIAGEPEAIMECLLNIYGSLYEENPDKLRSYHISTTPTLESELMLLQITDIE